MSDDSSSPTPPKGSVRSMISIFENQTIHVNSEPVYLIRRAKSMGSLSHRPVQKSTPKPIERIEPEKNLELAQIEQQVEHLQKNLTNNYKAYTRETHIYYQNQIIFMLTDIGNVETKNNPKTIHKKSELTEFLKKLNKKLNSLLPSGEEIVHERIVYKSDKRSEANVRNRKSGEISRIRTNSEGSSKYDKFGNRKRSFEEKREVITNVKEPVVVQEEQKVEEEKEEVDAPPVSVRSLKEIFEKNTNENEGKTQFVSTKISRKFTTFNSTSDLKYVPFSQRFKSSLDSDFTKGELKKQNSLDIESTTVEPFTPQMAPSVDEEEKAGDLTPDSLSNDSSSSSSSSEESDSEHTPREDLEGEA